MFKDICHQLCVVTTISKYKAKLDEVDKIALMLEKCVEWWHLRSHTFGPFRTPGLPGVNLAEQGNSSWKPKKPLWLVHAAKNDTATVVYLLDIKSMLTIQSQQEPSGHNRNHLVTTGTIWSQ